MLPDAWGFICPVHTPDGSPCGLLNHLTMNCIVSGAPDTKLVDNIPKVLVNLGMAPINSSKIDYKKYYVVILEGKIIGHVAMADSKRIADRLRLLKIDGVEVPNLLEVVLVPKKTVILLTRIANYRNLLIIKNVPSAVWPISEAVFVRWTAAYDAASLQFKIKENRIYWNI